MVALVPQGGLVASSAVLDSTFPGTAVACCSFKTARADVAFLHGVLQMVLVPLLGPASWAGSLGQLRIEYGLRQSLLWHPLHVARPSEHPLSHHAVHGVASASREHLVVWNFVLLGDSECSSQTAKVEGVQLPQLFAVERPGLGAIQQNGDDNGFVHLDLCE